MTKRKDPSSVASEMDEKKIDEMKGDDLLQHVANLSGLPEDIAYSELFEVLQKSEKKSQDVTLEDLRSAMLQYLEELQRNIELEESEDAPPSGTQFH